MDKFAGATGAALVARDKKKNYNASVSGQGRGQKRSNSYSNNQPAAKKGKFNNNNYQPAFSQQSVFSLAGSNHRGGGAARGACKGKSGGKGCAKN